MHTMRPIRVPLFLLSCLFLAPSGFSSGFEGEGSGLPFGCLYYQDFNDAFFPSQWIRIDNSTSQPVPLTGAWGIRRKSFGNVWGTHLCPDETNNRCAGSSSWYVEPAAADSWLISPKVVTRANTILRWISASGDAAPYADGYEVRISNGSSEVADFLSTPPLLSVPSESLEWTVHTVDLGAAGYTFEEVRIAFHHNSFDGLTLYIDDVSFGDNCPYPSCEMEGEGETGIEGVEDVEGEFFVATECSNELSGSQSILNPSDPSFRLEFSDKEAVNIVHKEFEDVDGALAGVRWWGTWVNPTDGPTPCDPATHRFSVGVYGVADLKSSQKGFNLFDPIHVVEAVIEPTVVGRTHLFGGADILEFEYRFDCPIPRVDYWIGIAGANDDTCLFTWASSLSGEQGVFAQGSGRYAFLRRDMAVCLLSEDSPTEQCLEPIACNPESMWGQRPPSMLDTGQGFVETKINYSNLIEEIALEYVSGLTDPIGELTWWGTHFERGEGGPEACRSYVGDFAVVFLPDNGGTPDTDLEHAYSVLVLDRFNHGYSEDLGVAFGAGNASVMAYHLRLNCPVAMTDGWIGVAPLYHDECTFHWSASKDGDGTSVQMVNGEAMTLDTDLALCLYPGPPPEGECVASVEGEGEGVPAVHHGADENEDGQISLSELLRVIQFFNSGGYSCDLPVSDPPTEDGYRPGSGDTSCSAHSSDYNPQDWAISLSELLRVIQFFNSGGYFHCPNADPPTEDGFCPGEAF